MNAYLTHHFASARETEIRLRAAEFADRVTDDWHDVPRRHLADLLGERLVHLGARLLTDRRTAERIESDLRSAAA